jgi:hypothetical protein
LLADSWWTFLMHQAERRFCNWYCPKKNWHQTWIFSHSPIGLIDFQEVTWRYVDIAFLCSSAIRRYHQLLIDFPFPTESLYSCSTPACSRNHGQRKGGAHANSSPPCGTHAPVWLNSYCFVQEKRLARAEGRPEPALLGSDDIRPLSMDDLKFACDQVRNHTALASNPGKPPANSFFTACWAYDNQWHDLL